MQLETMAGHLEAALEVFLSDATPTVQNDGYSAHTCRLRHQICRTCHPSYPQAQVRLLPRLEALVLMLMHSLHREQGALRRRRCLLQKTIPRSQRPPDFWLCISARGLR